MPSSFVQLRKISHHTVELLLNRPEQCNAFHGIMIEEILSKLDELERSMTHRFLVVRGAGRFFCAGGDIAWMNEICKLNEQIRLENANLIRDLFNRLHVHPRPTIAAVHGGALGGGVGVAVACDFVIATSASYLATSEGRLGIVPACLAPYLIRRVGVVKARQLFLSAARIPAAKALEMNLIDGVAESDSLLDSNVRHLIESLLPISPQAQLDSKALTLELAPISQPEQRSIQYLADSWGTEECIEGTQAFLEKRAPQWIATRESTFNA